uniref:Putative ribonuclease H-like domain-containing protein n=1 Tax=Tanacetum cinerariifolium TaxID=118510 RepID=A0A6L2P8D9_TANCI|nr:putative ribonuclease H-like domain-containing protein [Tanacetum cinerariifolium]
MINRQHGRMIFESVENGPLIWPSIEENGVTRPKKYSELSATEAIQTDCDVKSTNIILQGLPTEVYALNLALYDHEGWDETKEFFKPVKAISMPQGVPKTPDRRLLELEDQINFLLKGSQPTPTSSSAHTPRAYVNAVHPNSRPQNQNEPPKLNTFAFHEPHTERMKRFENAIFKQHEGINSRMTEMFGLLKELTASKTPEKVLIREEAKFPVTKNVNSISLTKGEEERSNRKEVTPDNAERPTKTKAEMPVKKAETKNEAKNRVRNKLIKTPENEEAVEAPGSEPVAYYLKHKINEKQIERLVDNNIFNNSLSGSRVRKKKGKTYKVLPRGPIYDAILKKKITKKEDIRGSFKIPCNVGGQKGINTLVDQGSDVNVMPYTTYIKLTYMKLTDEVLDDQLLSVSLLIYLGKHDCVERIPSESPRIEERVKTKYRGKNSDQPTSTAFLGWILFTDGASSTEGSRAGVVLTNPNGHKITYALHINFKTSNHEAEYEAIIAGLELAIHMEARHLQVLSDSLLITNQVIYKAKEDVMKKYMLKVRELKTPF